MKIYWYESMIENIFLMLLIPSIIGLALLRIFIDDVCTFGTHRGDGRRFRRIVR